MADNAEKKSLFRPTLIVAGLTSLSRVVGLIRDILISNVLGVSLSLIHISEPTRPY